MILRAALAARVAGAAAQEGRLVVPARPPDASPAGIIAALGGYVGVAVGREGGDAEVACRTVAVIVAAGV